MAVKKKRLAAIRCALEADLEQAARIWNERASLLQQTDARQQFSPDAILAWQRHARSWLRNDQCAFFVGEANGEICGYMVIMICDGPAGLEPAVIGKVVDMALDLHESRPGLGSALLDAARHWLLARDIAYLIVDVPATYPVEAAFWQAQGARARFVQNWFALSE